MKLSVHPESLIEWLALRLGLVPVPLVETQIAAMLARSVMAGVELGIFEALAAKPLPLEAIAARCGTELQATSLLLDSLTACNYLSHADDNYALKAQSRTWLLRDSKNSLWDKIRLQNTEWRWLEELERFVQSGQPLDFHNTMSDSELQHYHRSMRALAGIAGREAAWRIPIPRYAKLMLDLGGSHGHFAARICRRNPGLRAEVLDLPHAVETAAPMLAAEGLANRVVHVVGDVTRTDFGVERYDLILMSNLAHHLDEGENRSVACRSARALKPGGVFVIQEPVRLRDPARGGQFGALLGLYFALQSRPGVQTWSVAEMANWQSEAGLHPYKAVRLRTAPGWAQQSAHR